MKIKLLLAVFVGLFSGCASMIEEHQAQLCNYDGAYEQGVNDAQAGKPSRSAQVVYYCDESVKGLASKGYRDGYMKMKETPVININAGYLQQQPRASSCHAIAGQQIHENFCSRLNSTTCGVHNVCGWF